jgi:hypothetical protein
MANWTAPHCSRSPTLSAESANTGTFDLKPKNPLSAYNLFFQLERKRILAGTDGQGLPVTSEEIHRIIKEHNAKGKRLHRKSHGKIGFRELARTIANRWKKLDDETKKLLDKVTLVEKEKHTKKLKSWTALQKGNEEKMVHSQRKDFKIQEPTNERITSLINQAFIGNGTSKIESLLQIRDQIEAEMDRLSKEPKTFHRSQQELPQGRSLPRFYAVVEPEESFSRNFFDHDEDIEEIHLSRQAVESKPLASLVDTIGSAPLISGFDLLEPYRG